MHRKTRLHSEILRGVADSNAPAGKSINERWNEIKSDDTSERERVPVVAFWA